MAVHRAGRDAKDARGLELVAAAMADRRFHQTPRCFVNRRADRDGDGWPDWPGRWVDSFGPGCRRERETVDRVASG